MRGDAAFSSFPPRRRSYKMSAISDWQKFTLKVNVYEDGRVDPPGSARLKSLLSEASFEPRQGLPTRHRQFECRRCKANFVARTGEVTTHECEGEGWVLQSSQ